MIPRHYIRHPSEVPILIHVDDHADTLVLKDIGLGGLCVHTASCLRDHTSILIQIPLLSPPFEARGRVVWCHYLAPEQALLGICFADLETAYAVRMIEQICHIESYRQQISRERGYECSSEEAAFEWISLYAPHFPL